MQRLFISFEGPDGAGKSTQVRLLADMLTADGYRVTVTREPGGTPLGDKIRTLLLDPANSMCAQAEALLYAAARAQHVAEVIIPALNRGEIVITDRYADSTIVYQGIARALDHVQLEYINAFSMRGCIPDLTILLDAEIGSLRKRITERGEVDRIEQEGVVFHQAVREGFLHLAQKHSRMRVIPALGEPAAVHASVASLVRQFLERDNHEN